MYFADENLIGMGKLLRREGRDDIFYPGHEGVPEISREMDDREWMPLVAAREWMVLSRDRRIRSRPAELRVYHEHGIRSVWVGGKSDLGPHRQVEVFLQHEARLQRFAVRYGPGPWAVTLSPSGIRPVHLLPHPDAAP